MLDPDDTFNAWNKALGGPLEQVILSLRSARQVRSRSRKGPGDSHARAREDKGDALPDGRL